MTRLAFQAWDDFDVYTIASAIAGYTLRGGGAPTFKPQYSTPAILPFKRRYAEFLTDATTDYHAFSRDLVDADANRATFDWVFGFAKDLCTVEELHIYARGAGTATMTDFVRASIVLGTGAIRIDKMVASAYTAGSGASAGTVTLTAAHAYLCRFRGVAGAVSLKVWDAALGMAGEPAAFNLTPTGLTPTAAGWCAFGGKHSTLTGKVAAFNFDATATNGDTAICPLTNAEYTAWLGKQDVMRVVVAKMRATGYDSSGSPYTAVRKVYLANHGYTSAQQDSPSLQHFDNAITGIPTFSREMPAALSGQATVNFGRLRVGNPAVDVLVRQNLLVRSQELNTTWGPVAATIGVNATTAPDGTTTADKIQEDNTSNQHVVFQTITGTNGIEYVWSVYLKAAERTWAFISAFDGAADKRTWFNLSTGAVGTNAAGNSAAMEDAGGGWYRCTIKRVTADVDPAITIGCATADNTVVYVGTTGSGIYAWGAQLRQANRSPVYVAAVASAFNPPLTDQAPGLRDDWLRIHWLRDGFELLMGAPSWPLHDFRHIVRGRLGNPTAPDLKTLEFPIADMSEALNIPIQTYKFNGTDALGKYLPILLGQVGGRIDLQATDTTNLRYAIARGEMYTTPVLSEEHTTIYDNNIEIRGPLGLTIAAVNAGTDTLTASANHGMVDGYRVWLDGSAGAPPAPLAIETIYYAVSTTVGGADFKVSATRGGAAIHIMGTTTGAHFDGYGYDFELYADSRNVTRVKLAASPTTGGRLTASFLKAGNSYANVADPAAIMADAIFSNGTIGKLSLNYKDGSSFSALSTAKSGYKTGVWLDMELHLCAEVVGQIAAGTNCWYGNAPDGLIQVGAIALPSTASMNLSAGDIKNNSVRLVDSLRPVDFSANLTTYAPSFLTQGPIQNGSLGAQQPYSVMAPYSYGATSTPLDDFPALSDADPKRQFNLIAATGATADSMRAELVTLYKHKLGIFEFDTTLPAMERSIGETISLDFPRLGWKQFSATDPASPDNTATIDARLAVIIGINVNLAEKSPFKVRLKVFRRIPGFYPTANLN